MSQLIEGEFQIHDPMLLLELIMPDDFHHHLRDDNTSHASPMHDVLQIIAKKYARVLVMPNIKPPVRTLEDALAYRSRIFSQLDRIVVRSEVNIITTVNLS